MSSLMSPDTKIAVTTVWMFQGTRLNLQYVTQNNNISSSILVSFHLKSPQLRWDKHQKCFYLVNCKINTDIISCTFKIELVERHLRDLQG